MSLTPEELRQWATWFEAIATHRQVAVPDWRQLEGFAAYLRACADAEPVALIGENALGEQMLLRIGGATVRASPHRPTYLYTHPHPDETAALRAEVARTKETVRVYDKRIVALGCLAMESVHRDSLSKNCGEIARTETTALRARVAELEAQVAAKQAEIDRAAPLVKQIEAKVDALMLERCSDEMTPEQLTALVTHQQAIRARGAGEKA